MVALVKILTPFTARWAGVAAVLVTGTPLHHTGPSLMLLAGSTVAGPRGCAPRGRALTT